VSGHGLETGGIKPHVSHHPVVVRLGHALVFLNRNIIRLASLALIAASLILSYSVAIRYLFHSPTYWQDEASVFLLVGATFLASAHVQSRRGHVAIEAVSALLPHRVNRVRLLLVDIVSLAFCVFFAWKSWALLHEAWVDGQVSSSTWAPPLWIPYSVMSIGMTLLSAQILLQVMAELTAEHSR
jgi:TRAP-type C4-dicarboxylate transport system permease small subunit